jgi:hypothetical protein
MSLGAGIFDFMSAGLSVGDRVYPLALPQDVTLPALIYRVVSDTPTMSHSTVQDSPTWTGAIRSDTRVQFEAYALTYDEAEALADELEAYAVGYRGLWGDVEVDQVYHAGVRLDDREEDPGLWRVLIDLIVGHRTAISS